MEVIRLRDENGMSNVAIAELLGIHDSNVSSMYWRGKKYLEVEAAKKSKKHWKKK